MTRIYYIALVVAGASAYCVVLVWARIAYSARAVWAVTVAVIALGTIAAIWQYALERSRETPLQMTLLAIMIPSVVGAGVVNYLLEREHGPLSGTIGAATAVLLAYFASVIGAYAVWGSHL